MKDARTKRVPIRMCAACRRRAPKRSLVRFVASGDTLVLDRDYRAHGRGVYVCPDERCYAEAVRTKAFARALKKSSLAVPEGLRKEFLDFIALRSEGEGRDG